MRGILPLARKNRRRRKRIRSDDERRARGVTSRTGLTEGTIERNQSSSSTSSDRKGESKGRSMDGEEEQSAGYLSNS